MKRRWKILISTVAVLVVVFLIGVVRHYQLRGATEAYIAQLRAQGEPMDLAQVLPPPVPPEQNSADTIRQAAALMNPNEGWWITNAAGGMKMVAPGKAMVCSQQPNIRGDTFTDSWQEAQAAIASNKPAFALLRQITGKPDFDFRINYQDGFTVFNFTNLCLPEAKRAAERLSTAAIYDLHNGDVTSAVENVRATLAIAQGLRDERFVISELVRMAIAQIALTVNWEILQSSNLNDQQLAELQTNWASLDFVQSAEDAMAMERVYGQITTAKWRDSSAQLKHDLNLGPEAREKFGLKPESLWARAKLVPEIFLWRNWWSYKDQLRALKGDEVLIETVRSLQTNGSFLDAQLNQNHALDELGILKMDRDYDGVPYGEPNFHTLLSESVVSLSPVVERVMRNEAAKEIVITAIALKRYQLGHGNYPLDLNELVPEFLAAVPRDPVDGKPLRYRLNADGTFLLYSIGPNGKDDGGNPALERGVEGSNFYWLNPHALDWVWPQPATPEEIEKFYANQPR